LQVWINHKIDLNQGVLSRKASLCRDKTSSYAAAVINWCDSAGRKTMGLAQEGCHIATQQLL
jgi:hypothetical protein